MYTVDIVMGIMDAYIYSNATFVCGPVHAGVSSKVCCLHECFYMYTCLGFACCLREALCRADIYSSVYN